MSGSSQSQQLLTKATAHYHAGEYRQAIQVWQEILAQDPKNQRAMEGIRMASLLLEEAQTSEATAESADQGGASETPEVIGKVREGIQKVREFLSTARYLDAMEICQALLQLAPRSEAVREVLEEARDAYEAQPFINEHLEIARQLFIQERLDEALAEIQKIFFLSANHAEAKKLAAKIQALKQKQSSGPADPHSGEPDPMKSGSGTQQVRVPPDFGDSLDLPMTEQEAKELPAPASGLGSESPAPLGSASRKSEEPVLNEDWEAELAQLDLTPAAPPEKVSGESGKSTSDPNPIPLTDLSEDPALSSPAATEPMESPRASRGRADSRQSPPDPEFSALDTDLLKESPEMALDRLGQNPRPGRSVERSAERERPMRPKATPSPGGGFPLGKVFLGLLVLFLLFGGGWWMFTQRSASASGHGGGAGAPPPGRLPRHQPTASPGPTGGPSNVGLSSTGSRPANTASAQGASMPLPGGTAIPSGPPSSEDLKREIARLFATGKSQLARSGYEEAAATFSKILDLDPANLEAKDQMDQAASRVLEQKKLEEDLQTAKDYFVEKDFESALRKFYRLPKDRNLGEVDLFIRNAWYNWAVVSMKGGNCIEALQRLDEDLNAHPGDEEAAKLKEVAEHYRDRPKDKVFYAYVDRLTYRTLNQK